MTEQLLIAQLTDTHVVGVDNAEELYVDNNGRLDEAVASINTEAPSVAAVVVTGDLTNTGTAAEYEALREGLDKLDAPYFPLPGNHDDRGRLLATFPEMPWADGEHASWVMTVDNLRIIGLDSTIPGQPGAEFDDERSGWLTAVLGVEHDGPTVLAMHHPPFETGIEWMDKSGFKGLEDLAEVLRHQPVDRVICGHLHRPIVGTVAGITAQVGMSTVQHVDLDLMPDAPLSLVLDAPGYQIHRITGSDMVTHTRSFGTGNQGFVPEWGNS